MLSAAKVPSVLVNCCMPNMVLGEEEGEGKEEEREEGEEEGEGKEEEREEGEEEGEGKEDEREGRPEG